MHSIASCTSSDLCQSHVIDVTVTASGQRNVATYSAALMLCFRSNVTVIGILIIVINNNSNTVKLLIDYMSCTAYTVNASSSLTNTGSLSQNITFSCVFNAFKRGFVCMGGGFMCPDSLGVY